MPGGVRWTQQDVFNTSVELSNTQWDHIIDRHLEDLGDPRVFETDLRNTLPRPCLVYRSRSEAYSESEIFVGCASDTDHVGYVVMVSVKESDGRFIASAYPAPQVPRDGRLPDNVLHGTPQMHPCGNPRSSIKESLNDRFPDVFAEVLAQMESDNA